MTSHTGGMLTKKPIYCFKETKISFDGLCYVIGHENESKKLNDRIMRHHIKKNKGKWFEGKMCETNQCIPEAALKEDIEYDFRTQGLICGYCGGGTSSGHYFKPQSLGNHLKKSCIKIVSPTVIQKNKEVFKKNYKTWKEVKKTKRLVKKGPIWDAEKVLSQLLIGSKRGKPLSKSAKTIIRQLYTDAGPRDEESDEEMDFAEDEDKNSPPHSTPPPQSTLKPPTTPTILSDSDSTTSDNEEAYHGGPHGGGWCTKCYKVRPCDLCTNCAYYRTCKNRDPKTNTLHKDMKVCFLHKEDGVKDAKWEWFDGTVGFVKRARSKSRKKILYVKLDNSVVDCNERSLRERYLNNA